MAEMLDCLVTYFSEDANTEGMPRRYLSLAKTPSGQLRSGWWSANQELWHQNLWEDW
jgi:hypothetical protein